MGQPAGSAPSGSEVVPPALERKTAGESMSAREAILGRVRDALKRSPGAPVPPLPEVRLTIPQVSIEDRISSFCIALEKLAGRPFVADSAQSAADYVREIVGERVAVATDSSAVRECGVRYPPVEMSKAAVGITGADYGLADTGTLVVLSASDPRLASLLPPVHVALLKRDRILSGLDELLTILPR